MAAPIAVAAANGRAVASRPALSPPLTTAAPPAPSAAGNIGGNGSPLGPILGVLGACPGAPKPPSVLTHIGSIGVPLGETLLPPIFTPGILLRIPLTPVSDASLPRPPSRGERIPICFAMMVMATAHAMMVPATGTFSIHPTNVAMAATSPVSNGATPRYKDPNAPSNVCLLY